MYKPLALAFVVVLFGGCRSKSSEQQSVDTAMVFVAAPPSPANPPSRDQMHAFMAAMSAYSNKQISADSAAKVIVDYMRRTGRPLNLAMDAALSDAVDRELKKPHH